MLVLGELLNQGYITREEYDEAVAQELVLKNGIGFADTMAYCTNESLKQVKVYDFENDIEKEWQ